MIRLGQNSLGVIAPLLPRTVGAARRHASRAIYVYVIPEGCKRALSQPIRDPNVTRHGNVEVLWLRAEKPAVDEALRALD